MPEPLRQRWTKALDTGRFDIRPVGPDADDPGTYRFEAFLTDGGSRTSIRFPVYDLAPFLDLPETPEDVHRVRHLSASFVDALSSGDLATCSSMVSFDEGFLRGEQPIFSSCSFKREGEPGRVITSKSNSRAETAPARSDRSCHCGSTTRAKGGRSSDITVRAVYRSKPIPSVDLLLAPASGANRLLGRLLRGPLGDLADDLDHHWDAVHPRRHSIGLRGPSEVQLDRITGALSRDADAIDCVRALHEFDNLRLRSSCLRQGRWLHGSRLTSPP